MVGTCPIRLISTAISLPAGVTLQAIDGETVTGLQQSNNYYNVNGFTYAHNAGWDSTTFFPFGSFLADIGNSTQAGVWLDLGWNTAFDLNSSVTTELFPTNPIYFVDNVEGGTTLKFGTGQNTAAYYVCTETYDEPPSYAAGATTPIGGTANAAQDPRPWYVNATWTYVYGIAQNAPTFNAFLSGGGFSGTGLVQTRSALTNLIATPNSTTRHMNLTSIDCYYFAGTPPSANWVSGQFFGGTPYEAGLIYTNTGSTGSPGYTVDQTARACRYGDTIDVLRSAQPTFPAPIMIYIEDGQPYEASGTQYYITPPQLNAAFWSAIMHGCRGIGIFDHTFDAANSSDNNMYTVAQGGSSNFATTVQTTLYNWGQGLGTAGNGGGGFQSITMYAQMKATCQAILLFAPIINSPYAISYASISPAGWIFGQSAMPINGTSTASSILSGFDICAKWYQGGNTNALVNGFYVMVLPRYSQITTNQTATITLADTHATIANAIAGINFAAASWATSSSTITMNNFNPGWVVSGMTVYDLTNGKIIGTVSSWSTSSTTLTLNANAAFASSGSTDMLMFYTIIPISGGQFTDTFADGNTFKIYQING
jgi:hypothetical protein